MSRYDVKSILESSTLPIGAAAKRLKEQQASENGGEASVNGRMRTAAEVDDHRHQLMTDAFSAYTSQHQQQQQHHHHHGGWPTIAFQQPQPLGFHGHYPYGQARVWCKQEQDAAAAHSLQDLHQLHLSSTTTHNFLQPAAAALHNLISLDSSSLEHSTGSNSIIYNNNGNMSASSGSYHGVVGDGHGGGFMVPISTVVADHQSHHATAANHGSCTISSFGDVDEGKHMVYHENMFGNDPDPYAASRNSFYLLQNSVSAVGNNNWTSSTAAAAAAAAASSQAEASRANNNSMAVCNNGGAPLFTVWNDA